MNSQWYLYIYILKRERERKMRVDDDIEIKYYLTNKVKFIFKVKSSTYLFI